ncbi:hypothetical protein SAMN04488122_6567 [Chitinophaga arvensicola]|uniref:Uncharacterized protein n=1 Tax=Chitinophaga arvensicola TaxID=29529 RepID=A0A1I0SDH9_9BACT|nr:hypothetical protein SAMN04488122_6567 [Chitinophaga arvensicola]
MRSGRNARLTGNSDNTGSPAKHNWKSDRPVAVNGGKVVVAAVSKGMETGMTQPENREQ